MGADFPTEKNVCQPRKIVFLRANEWLVHSAKAAGWRERLFHFQRDQVARPGAARLVIGINLAVVPVARKVVGANEKQRLVVCGAEFQDAGIGVDRQNCAGRIRAIDGNQAASYKFCGAAVAWVFGRSPFGGGLTLLGVLFQHVEGRFLGFVFRLTRTG